MKTTYPPFFSILILLIFKTNIKIILNLKRNVFIKFHIASLINKGQ